MSEPLRHNRDFMLLWSGQVVSALGSAVSSVAFPMLVLAPTQSPSKAVVIGADWVRAASCCSGASGITTTLAPAAAMFAITGAASRSPAVQHAPRVTASAARLDAPGATPAP